jgi:NAD+ synthase
VVAALCARAVGKERVLGLFMPEAESSDDSIRLGRLLVDSLGIKAMIEDIGPILNGASCYQRRDDAVRVVIPEYNNLCRSKMILPSILEGAEYRIYSVVAQMPDGARKKARLSADAYLRLVAATNFKQRARKMMEYYHADRLNYAVAGSVNRLEYDQGVFCQERRWRS